MSSVVSQRTTHLRADSPELHIGLLERARRYMAYFGIGYLMLGALNRFPWFVRLVRPAVLWIVWNCARVTRRHLMLNAARLLGETASIRDRRAHCKHVLRNFYEFIYEMGHSQRVSVDDLAGQIAAVHGRANYDAARTAGKGAILVTAHLGSYEVGIASLRQIEPRVHVVFRRDPMNRFEQLRSSQHERLGVIEAPADDGLAMWMNLRDALARNEVVLMQGDRVMPDQRGERIAFCDGHMLFPAGPIKLALATGAPIVPIFAVRQADGRVNIFLEEPIDAQPVSLSRNEVHPALLQTAAVIERYVRKYPDQWLRVQSAFCEDIEVEGQSRR